MEKRDKIKHNYIPKILLGIWLKTLQYQCWLPLYANKTYLYGKCMAEQMSVNIFKSSSNIYSYLPYLGNKTSNDYAHLRGLHALEYEEGS